MTPMICQNDTQLKPYVIWSKLTNKPLFVSISGTDINLCFWNGVMISKNHAVSIVMSLMHINIAPNLYDIIFKDYANMRKYISFDNRIFDVETRSLFPYENIETIMGNTFFENLESEYTPIDMLSWLLSSNQTQLSLQYEIQE